MKTRKIILLSAIGVLAAVYALQLIYQGKNKVRDDVLKRKADTIQVAYKNGTGYTLRKDADTWRLDGGREADSYAAGRISDAVQTVKILGKVSAGTDAQRFGFDDQTALTVTASENGSVIRTIRIGKAAGTAMQTYILLDDSQEVLLASGDLNGIFGKTEEELAAKKAEPNESGESGENSVTR